MSRFTMLEQVIGVPLWVPDAHDFFEIEEEALPNGDPCLVMRGDINAGYKAFMKAPVMSKDVLNTSDHQAGREWSMSCWLKLVNLGSAAPGNAQMFGCSTYADTATDGTTGQLPNQPFMVQANNVNGFYVSRWGLNNGGADAQQRIRFTAQTGNLGFTMFQDYWFLFVLNFTQSFSSPNYTVTGQVYLDTYASGMNSDTAVGAASGVYNSPRYLHIGGYGSAQTGRADLWRMAKWAFHDHALTQAERIEMWQAMYGTVISFVDDFNRSSIGTNWRVMGSNALSITSNQVVATDATTYKSVWVKDLGTPNMYSEIIATEISGGWARANVRCPNFAATLPYYTGGWNQSGTVWTITRVDGGGETSMVSTGSGPPSFPCTIRLESEDNAGDVDLRLYVDGVLKLSHTDSTGSKILNQSNAGLEIRGGASQTTSVTNFECGTL
jgi:hypothetical protein